MSPGEFQTNSSLSDEQGSVLGWTPSHGLHTCSPKPSSSFLSWLVGRPLGSSSRLEPWPWLHQYIPCPWRLLHFLSLSFSASCLQRSGPPHPQPPPGFAQGVILSCRSPEGIVSFHAGRERSKIIFFLITQLRLGSNLHFKVLLIRI